jgi:epoxide hydrolase
MAASCRAPSPWPTEYELDRRLLDDQVRRWSSVTGVADPVAFRIDITPDAVDDLRRRLEATRWPDKETVDDWSQGAPLAFVRDLCDYWARTYDFEAAERRFNAFPQFRTGVSADGASLGVHFLHVRSPEPGAMPLILTHGWPGSVVEFFDVIGPLTDPVRHGGSASDAFHVVVPSLPGYGWSDKPTSPGWTVHRIARAWDDLMVGLGYGRYGAQGGDWGAMVTTSLGQQVPEHLVGVHVNMAVVSPDKSTFDDLTEREQAALAAIAEHRATGGGYSSQQSTRPQTLGYGLADSPAGQCAWIVEKFWAWTDCAGDPYAALSADKMLDNVMAYWLPGTGASSARLYWESFRDRGAGPVELPSGISVFPGEILRVSRRWAEQRFTDLRWFSEPEAGGHFAAFEQPSLFVNEVRNFFRLVR